MKRLNFLYFIGIGFLLFLPFIRVSVATPPSWVKIKEGDVYIWQYNNHTANAAGAWMTDGIPILTLGVLGLWVGPFTEDQAGYGNTGTMSHEIDTVGDLGPDLEYGSNYQSVEITHKIVWSYTAGAENLGGGSGSYNWTSKDTGTNIWNGLIIENATEFALWHDDLTIFFDVYSWFLTSLWVNPNMDWAEVVAAANIGLADVNATATVVTDSVISEVNGFKITIAALAWGGANSLAIGLSVTYDECGLLNTWDLTYGTDTIMDIDQTQGGQYTPCQTITVTNPTGLIAWETGTSHVINWNSTSGITNVKIDLYRNVILEATLSPSTLNNGSYSWTIPYGLVNSTLYQIKITDVSNSLIYNFSDYFEIYTPPAPPTPADLTQEIPGYDQFMIVGIFSIISLIIIKRGIRK